MHPGLARLIFVHVAFKELFMSRHDQDDMKIRFILCRLHSSRLSVAGAVAGVSQTRHPHAWVQPRTDTCISTKSLVTEKKVVHHYILPFAGIL